MKKLILIITVAALFGSCKKEKTKPSTPQPTSPPTYHWTGKFENQYDSIPQGYLYMEINHTKQPIDKFTQEYSFQVKTGDKIHIKYSSGKYYYPHYVPEINDWVDSVYYAHITKINLHRYHQLNTSVYESITIPNEIDTTYIVK